MRDEVAAQKPPSANKDKVLIRGLNFYYGQTHASGSATSSSAPANTRAAR